jgi:hypothetical protein
MKMVKKSRMITGLPTSTGRRGDRIKLFDHESEGQFAFRQLAHSPAVLLVIGTDQPANQLGG